MSRSTRKSKVSDDNSNNVTTDPSEKWSEQFLLQFTNTIEEKYCKLDEKLTEHIVLMNKHLDEKLTKLIENIKNSLSKSIEFAVKNSKDAIARCDQYGRRMSDIVQELSIIKDSFVKINKENYQLQNTVAKNEQSSKKSDLYRFPISFFFL